MTAPQPTEPTTSQPNEPRRDFPAEGGDAYLAVAQARMDRQLDDIDALDAKAGIIIGAALAQVAVVLGIWALRGDAPLGWWRWALLAATAVALSVTLALAGVALRVRGWRRYPDPADAWALRHRSRLAWELAMVIDDAFDKNATREHGKQGLVRTSIFALGALTAVVLGTSGALVWSA